MREALAGTALAVLSEEVEADGWLRLEVAFQDDGTLRGRCGSLPLGAEGLTPPGLRTALHERAGVK